MIPVFPSNPRVYHWSIKRIKDLQKKARSPFSQDQFASWLIRQSGQRSLWFVQIWKSPTQWTTLFLFSVRHKTPWKSAGPSYSRAISSPASQVLVQQADRDHNVQVPSSNLGGCLCSRPWRDKNELVEFSMACGPPTQYFFQVPKSASSARQP